MSRIQAQIAIGLVKKFGVALAEVARQLDVSTWPDQKIMLRAYHQVNLVNCVPYPPSGKHPMTVKARSLLCYWAVRQLGFSATELSKRLRISGGNPTASGWGKKNFNKNAKTMTRDTLKRYLRVIAGKRNFLKFWLQGHFPYLVQVQSRFYTPGLTGVNGP